MATTVTTKGQVTIPKPVRDRDPDVRDRRRLLQGRGGLLHGVLHRGGVRMRSPAPLKSGHPAENGRKREFDAIGRFDLDSHDCHIHI